MLNPQARRLADEIKQILPSHASVEDAAEAKRKELEGWGISIPDSVLAEARAEVSRSISEVEILRRNSIVKENKRWYSGPSPGDHHWPALDNYLRNTKSWGDEAVASIDTASNEIVSLLDDPADDQFCCKGLVVGYVQSGKTANMTAVIAKAVDAGYNLVVVLGGVTNKLRAQTQRRMQADIVDRHRHLWNLYTTPEDDGDFTYPKNGQFTMPREGFAQLAVMKKEGSRLRAFIKTIERTPVPILEKLRVLLIDDECDQASVNSARGDYDMTRINEAIRMIITKLPCVSYVGYTATPFANVFIDPFPFNRDELDDLYPTDFITSLPRPSGYFGAVEVFGHDEAEDESERDMVRIVPEDEPARLRPTSRLQKESFRPEMTSSLVDALLWFIACCSIRRLRGQNDHNTMLVHASQYVAQHRQMADVMREWLNRFGPEIGDDGSEIGARFAALYAEEGTRTGSSVSDEIPENLDDVRAVIPEVLESLEFAVENGETDPEYRLDYSGGPKTYVAIGGTVLARGLTLEGLTVSLFLRTSRQYDTLLQMGRWFGYRPGYEDLPRLWTTADLISKFRALATVEEEIREDIAIYREHESVTPTSFAVRVRSIPGMAITSASKMKHALPVSISFEGQHIQTIRFDHLSLDVVRGNWRAASVLADRIAEEGTREDERAGRLYRGVSMAAVRRFISDVDICNRHMTLKKDLLLGYIDKFADKYPLWNVGLIEPNGAPVSREPMGAFGPVGLVRRAKLKANADDFADIKALMSKSDILIDVDDPPEQLKGLDWSHLKEKRPDVPLLLIYPIDAESQPRNPGKGGREALDAVGDLVGFGMVFPGQKDRSGNYYSVDLDVPDPEYLDEQEDELAEVEGESTSSRYE